MRITRIHHPEPLAPGQEISLQPQAATHLTRVLRVQAGTELTLFNGDGNEYTAVISRVQRNHAWADITHVQAIDRESPLDIHLGQGISKGDRMDYTIQKAIELGVSTITPLMTEHSTVQLKADRLKKRLKHWQGIIHSACEQCGRNRVPIMNKPLALEQWLVQIEKSSLKLTLAPNADHSFNTMAAPDADITLLVGPEGGLSELEIKLSLEHGFTGLRLGPRILRTETAAVTCLSVIQSRWGDLQ